MRITIFISNMLNSGGTERVAANMANMFADRGHSVQILSLRSEHKSFYQLNENVRLTFLGIANRQHNTTKFGYLWQILSGLRAYIKTEKPDVVLAIWTDLAIFSVLAAIGLKTRIIVCEHTNFARKLTNHERLRPLVYPFATAIVALTEKDIHIYSKMNKRSFVIPNAVKAAQIPQNVMKRNVVIAVGRITKIKGFDMLIESWQIAHRELKNWQLKIIGNIEDSDYAAMLQRKIIEYELLESITITPAVTDIFKEYSMAKIFVLSSRVEGLPMVLIEAMAMGVPVVSFDCPTGPEELIVDGVTGVLVDNGNVQELAEKIIRLAKDESLQKKYAANAKIDIHNKLSEDIIYTKWMKVFADVNK